MIMVHLIQEICVLHTSHDTENVDISTSDQRYYILYSTLIFDWVIIGHDRNMLPDWYQGNIWTNADLP